MRGIACSVVDCDFHTDSQVSRHVPLHFKMKLLEIHTNAVHFVHVGGNHQHGDKREDVHDVEILRVRRANSIQLERLSEAKTTKERYEILKGLGIVETVVID